MVAGQENEFTDVMIAWEVKKKSGEKWISDVFESGLMTSKRARQIHLVLSLIHHRLIHCINRLFFLHDKQHFQYVSEGIFRTFRQKKMAKKFYKNLILIFPVDSRFHV